MEALSAALLLTSCASLSASPSGSGGAIATPTSTPRATSSASASPEASDQAPTIEVNDYLEVTGEGLAVRSGPSVEYPLVSEYLLGRTEPLTTTLLRSEVRLPVGHVVQVSLGPLVVDETTWFAVRNVPQAGQTDADTPIWRTRAPVAYSEIDFELTWMAAAQPGVAFVRTTDRPACAACSEGPPSPTAEATGFGDGRVGPWLNRGGAWITFAAASADSSGACEFRITNPEGLPMFANEAAVDYLSAQIPGVSPSPDTPPDEPVWLDVSGNCGWAFVVYVSQG